MAWALKTHFYLFCKLFFFCLRIIPFILCCISYCLLCEVTTFLVYRLIFIILTSLYRLALLCLMKRDPRLSKTWCPKLTRMAWRLLCLLTLSLLISLMRMPRLAKPLWPLAYLLAGWWVTWVVLVVWEQIHFGIIHSTSTKLKEVLQIWQWALPSGESMGQKQWYQIAAKTFHLKSEAKLLFVSSSI